MAKSKGDSDWNQGWDDDWTPYLPIQGNGKASKKDGEKLPPALPPVVTGNMHAHGIQTAYKLDWGKHSTVFTGGGSSYQGSIEYREANADLVISAVSVSLGSESMAHDMQCAQMLTPVNVKRILSLKWPDYGVPKYERSFWLMLTAEICNLKMTEVHCQCMGGNGRTGTMLCIIYQLATGKFKTATELIKHIRKAYRSEAVESEAQAEYIAKVCEIDLGNTEGMFHKYIAPVTTWKGSASTTSYGTDLSADDQKLSNTPDFIKWDDQMKKVTLTASIRYYKAWIRCGKPEVHIGKVGSPSFIGVDPKFIIPDSISVNAEYVHPDDIVANPAPDEPTK